MEQQESPERLRRPLDRYRVRAGGRGSAEGGEDRPERDPAVRAAGGTRPVREESDEGQVGEQRRGAQERQHRGAGRREPGPGVVAEMAEADGEEGIEGGGAAGDALVGHPPLGVRRRPVAGEESETGRGAVAVRGERDRGAVRRSADHPGEGLRARPVVRERPVELPLRGEDREEGRKTEEERQERRHRRPPGSRPPLEPPPGRAEVEADAEFPEQPPRQVEEDREQQGRRPAERRLPPVERRVGVRREGGRPDRHRDIPEPRAVEGEDDREDIRREEEPVEHLRQEERGEQRR